MSKYTVELRYICETMAGLEASVGGDDVDQVIQNAIPSIFNFSFPIFDESYRNVLETKILMHYYTREIAHETVGLWKLKLKTKLNEIMPYYNQLYKSELLEFNPLYDVDIIRSHVRDSSGTRDTENKTNTDSTTDTENNQVTNNRIQNHNSNTGDGTNNTSRNNTNKYSDTPQGAITDLATDKYLTNARQVNETDNTASHWGDTTEQNGTTDGSVDTTGKNEYSSNTDSTSNTNLTDTETYLEHVQGKQGSGDYSDMLLKFRNTFLNIDMMVINELEELFFQLW